MRKVWSAILISLTLFLISGAFLAIRSDAQIGAEEGWTFLDGPTAPGGTVDAIAVAPSAPDALYALMRGHAGERLFRSDDAALTWQQAYTFTAAVDAVAVDPVDPATLYAGAPDGLFRSTDGGLSWTQVYTVGAVFAVASPTLLYTGGQIAGPNPDAECYTGYFGVARSDDGGATWRMTPIGCAADLTVIAVHPQNSNIVYAGGSDWTGRVPLLLRSANGGITWTRLPLTTLGSHSVVELVLDPTQPERLFASDYHGVLRSTDGGDTWERLDRRRQALPAEPFRLAVDANGTVYAVRAYALEGTSVYRSDDGGETWWVSVTQLPRGASALVADPLRPGTLYSGLSEYGVFRSSSGGGAWQERNAGIRSLVSVSALAVAPGNPNLIYAGADKPRGGLFRSTDGGLTWTEVITDTPILATAVNPVTPTIAYAGGIDRLYSTHDGQRWAWSFPGLRINDIAIASQNPEWVYAGGDEDRQGYIVRRTPNTTWYGPQWVKIPVSDTLIVSTVAVHPYDPDLVFAGGRPLSSYGRVYRSRDAGESWQEVLAGIPGDVNALVMHPHRPDIMYASTNSAVIYRSLDWGDTWERWSNRFFNGLYDLTLDTLGVPYQATGDGVYRWEASQAVWVPFGLQGQWVHALVVSHGPPQVLLAGTDAGVWRRALPLWQVWLPLVRR